MKQENGFFSFDFDYWQKKIETEESEKELVYCLLLTLLQTLEAKKKGDLQRVFYLNASAALLTQEILKRDSEVKEKVGRLFLSDKWQELVERLEKDLRLDREELAALLNEELTN